MVALPPPDGDRVSACTGAAVRGWVRLVGTEPPPPVITITNPAAPGPLSDVIGVEASRPPRRLTSAQRRLAWLAAVIAATTALGLWGAGRIRTGDRLDRQALRELGIVPVGGDASLLSGTDDVDLSLLSTGPHPVTVVSARLAVPGYPTLRADHNELTPHEPEVVTFASPAACPASLPMSFDAPIELRVRTYRGDERTLELPSGSTTDAFTAGFALQTMDRCGLYPPAFSIETRTPVGAEQRGHDLLFTLSLHNRSRAERSISSLRVNGGLQLRGGTSTIVLSGGETTNLPLRLHVADCPLALGSWALVPQQQGFAPAFRVVGGGSLEATVMGDGTVTDSIGLLNAGDELITHWVRETCAP